MMGLKAYFCSSERGIWRKMLLVLINLSLLWVSVTGIDITDRVFSKVDYKPVAFGDFNSDKMTDVFVLTEEQRTLTILMSHTEEPLLRDQGYTCQFSTIDIKNVVPSDFDGDGAMDVMLISLSSQGPYGVHILWGSLNKLDCGTEEKPLILMKGQPLVFDYNGDMISDLFSEDENGQGMIWLASKNRTFTKVSIPAPLSSRLRIPSSHAFIDLNNDLVADVLITTEDHYEIWIRESGNFVKKKDIDYPDSIIGQTSFADINLDGSIEILLPVCKSSCTDSKIYAYMGSQWIDLEVNFKDPQGRLWHFPDGQEMYMDTITLRVGDYNLDGYPDILATLVGPDSKSQVTLLENVPCQKCKHPRTFAAQWGRFHHWNESVMGTFFDFEEDGSLDVILVHKQSPGKYQVAAYKNSIEYDAMFVKVLVLTGRCYLDCPHSQVPYGTNLPGPAITYTITTATGDLQISRTTQLSQTAHLALQLPYSVFGLGRNWNFVDVLSVGMPQTNDTKELIGRFTQIIPNSQLIVIPYPLDDPSRWAYKLFITPGKAMLKTAGALIGTMLFVACIIFVLHYQEKKQDKKEKLQEAHKFHFDAM